MVENRCCPQCGAQLPDDAPAGLCPKCLVKAGFDRKAESERSAEASDPAVQPTAKSPADSSTGFESPPLEELTRLFPQLDVLELLGKGGMGAVYKARQKGLARLVAVKILPPEIEKDPSFAERFTREAQSLARLSHPNIVAVHDFGRTEGLYYFVMEYVDGANLRQTIQAGNIQAEEALAIVPQICDALQYAHDEGIVHRDIKPENILLDKKGRVKIADFGLAKLLGHAPDDISLTGTQQVMGTLRYMAPEQMEGAKGVDHRADVYSLGVVFYELLTGELPIGRFAPPSEKVEIDVRLDEVVLRALEKEPEQRYQHASGVKTDVEAIVSTTPRESLREAADREELDSSSAVRLAQMLGVAVGLVFSMLCTTIGVLLFPAAFMFSDAGSGPFWGWMGGAFGCFFGGFGGLAGSWNTYRQLRGQLDWMKMSRWTGFDYSLAAYGALGLVLLGGGILAKVGVFGLQESDVMRSSVFGLLLLGGIIVFQASLFLMYRAPFLFRGSREDAETSRRSQP